MATTQERVARENEILRRITFALMAHAIVSGMEDVPSDPGRLFGRASKVRDQASAFALAIFELWDEDAEWQEEESEVSQSSGSVET